jgi:hypothetical protein
MDATEAAEYLEKRRQFAASVADVTSYYRQAVSEVQGFLDQVRVDGPGLTEGNAKPGKRRFALVAKKIAYAAKQIKGQKLQAENFVNLMLTELGEYLSYKSKTSWIQGPVKLVAGALAKTVNDYKLIWTNNKDLVRGTLAAKERLRRKIRMDWIWPSPKYTRPARRNSACTSSNTSRGWRKMIPVDTAIGTLL